MSLATSGRDAPPLLSLAVYCPLLCEDDEERAQDNILFFAPPETSLNRQMNHVGFCTAMSSLAGRFGVRGSNRQTICKQCSSVCLRSPVPNLWVSAHVRGGVGEAETTHQLLQRSCAVFELLYGLEALPQLTRPLRKCDCEEEEEGPSVSAAAAAIDGNTSVRRSSQHETTEARTAVRSFFTRCAAFLSVVLTSLQQTRVSDVVTPLICPSLTMTSSGWAAYLCTEGTLGYPLHYVGPHELPHLQLSDVENAVQRHVWSRACSAAPHSRGNSGDDSDTSARCCVFCLPSLYIVSADSRLSSNALLAIKFYLMLYAPIQSSSFACYLPDAGRCEMAVWQDGNVVALLLESQPPPKASTQPEGAQTADTVPVTGTEAPSTVTEDAPAPASSSSGLPPSPNSVSLLQTASAVAAEVRSLLVRHATGAATPSERDRYWISTSHSALHNTYYKAIPTALASDVSPLTTNVLVAHLRLVGHVRCVEGTSLLQLRPGFVEHVRTIVTSTQLTVAASAGAARTSVWELWTRWDTIWIYVRFTGSAVTVLAWRSPVNIRRLAHDAKRILQLAL